MSSLYDSSGKPIPMGILVKNAKQPERSERPTPRRKSESGERQIPWLWIAGGGSAGWVIIVLVIALLTRGQERMVEQDRPLPLPRAVDGPLAEAPLANVKVVKAIDVAPEAAEIEPMPGPRGPRLIPKQIKPEDAPPPIDVAPAPVPEDVPLILPAPGAEPAPRPVPAPVVIKPNRRDVDLKVFANCEQIGTDVLFVKDPPKAFLRAKDQKKMVFMVHLSGNLEDPGFT